MIKHLAVFATMFIATALFSQDQSLLNYVPKDVDGFICVNVQNVMSHPKLKEFIDSPKEGDTDFIELKKLLTDNGVDIYKAISNGVIYFRIKGQNGGIIKTTVNENLLKTLLEKNEKTKGKLNKSVVKGKTIYSMGDKKPEAAKGDADGDEDTAAPMGPGKETFFAYAAPDILVISDKKDEISKMLSMQDGEKVAGNAKLMNLSSKIDKASTIWGVCEYNPPDRNKGQDDQADMSKQMLPIDNICGGSIAVNLTGEKKDAISMNLKLNCLEKMKAQMLTVQLQALVMMAIPNISQGNAQLGEDLTKAIKFANDENDIVINLELTSSLMEQIQKASENMGRMQGPGQAPDEGEEAAPAAAPAAPIAKGDKPEAKPAEAAPKAK